MRRRSLPNQMTDNIYIEVEGYAGSSVAETVRRQIELANKLGIDVWMKANGERLLARPGDSIERVLSAFDPPQLKADKEAFVHWQFNTFMRDPQSAWLEACKYAREERAKETK